MLVITRSSFFFFNDTATTEIYTLSLHDALPICGRDSGNPLYGGCAGQTGRPVDPDRSRSEEHTSELQSLAYLVCRLLLEKKKERPMSLLLAAAISFAATACRASPSDRVARHLFP